MKNVVLTFLFLLFTTASLFSQPQSGKYTVGGNTSFMFDDKPLDINFTLNPFIGKFLKDDILLEGGIGYSFYYDKSLNDSITTISSDHHISGNINLIKFFPISEKFYFTIGGFFGATDIPSIRRTKYTPGNTFTSVDFGINTYIGASPGLSYFLNEKLALSLNFGSVSYRFNYSISTNEADHYFRFNFNTASLKLGMRYLF